MKEKIKAWKNKTSRKDKKEKNYFKTFLQIYLVVSLTFAFSYILHSADVSAGSSANANDIITIKEKRTINWAYYLEKAVRFLINDKNLVSAVSTGDAVNTCIESKDGKVCQEYITSECADKCTEPCLPFTRNNAADCKLGTCYDANEGTCEPNSPKKPCEDNGGEWINDVLGNDAKCEKGCCDLGGQTMFTTTRECEVDGGRLGVNEIFHPEISTELGCWVLSKIKTYGACISTIGEEKKCDFLTGAECQQIPKSQFRDGFLCTYPEFNVSCQKQAKTDCIDGKDEIYWFDSCGNRENIYEGSLASQKEHSWNNGKVLAKDSACAIGSSLNPIANAHTCGNCDYITGSKCGQKTSSEKLSDSTQGVVCRDLNCVDKNGKKRITGESWCEYQSSTGTEKGSSNLLRATDTPGSRDFRMSCKDGEIITSPCQDYRAEICTEAQQDVNGDKVSFAACRLNGAMECISYNTEEKKEEGIKKCEKNPDCFVKEVNVPASSFNFKVCAPKYPYGNDLSENSESAEAICGIATLKCTAASVKKIGGKKWTNRGCLTDEFGKQMNDLCMSLGDCGASVNYLGEMGSSGYKISGSTPQLSENYLSGLESYAGEKIGKYIEAADVNEFYNSLGGVGIPTSMNDVNFPKGFGESGALTTAGMAVGGAGLLIAMYPGIVGATNLAVAAVAAHAATAATATTTATAATPALAAHLTALGGAAAGAAIGFAAGVLLIKILGIGGGLDPVVTMILLAGMAVGGAMLGITATSATVAWTGAFAWVPIVGLIIIIVMILIMVILKIIGIGKVRYYYANFECSPWQPPLGGDKCSDCGKDGFPCSEYSCKSLGLTCEFFNEGTKNQICANVPVDAIPPIIKPLEGVLPEGFSYSDVSERGFKIKSSADDGCIPTGTQGIVFGISLHEPGRCTIRTETPSALATAGTGEDAEDSDIPVASTETNFGGRNLFLFNHTQLLAIPALESFGESSINPISRAEIRLYVTCEDKAGHKNDADYVISACASPQKDITSPIITARLPVSEFVAFNKTEVNVSIFTSEPADCNWDFENKDYKEMENNFSCANNFEDIKLLGWECSALLPFDKVNSAGKKENTYFVTCKDQPWLAGTENESDRNMKEYNFTLKESAPLEIVSISPSNDTTLVFGTEPASVTIEVETRGGILDGIAQCSYLMGVFRPFANTLDNIHSQTFDAFTSGNKTIGIKCEDVIGNIAYGTSNFSILIDNIAPTITRLYKDSGKLIVVTNEKADCFYNNNGCEFGIMNESERTAFDGSEFRHGASFDEGKTYYIKCKDGFDNYLGDCNAVVKDGVI